MASRESLVERSIKSVQKKYDKANRMYLTYDGFLRAADRSERYMNQVNPSRFWDSGNFEWHEDARKAYLDVLIKNAP